MAKKMSTGGKTKLAKKKVVAKKPPAKAMKKPVAKKAAKVVAKKAKTTKKAAKPTVKAKAKKSVVAAAKSAKGKAQAMMSKAKKQVNKQVKNVKAAAGRAIKTVKHKAQAAGATMSDVLDTATGVVATTAGAIVGAIEAATTESKMPGEMATSAAEPAPVEAEPLIVVVVEDSDTDIPE